MVSGVRLGRRRGCECLNSPSGKRAKDWHLKYPRGSWVINLNGSYEWDWLLLAILQGG